MLSSVKFLPPQTIIWLPVQTAVTPSLPSGTDASDPLSQVSSTHDELRVAGSKSEEGIEPGSTGQRLLGSRFIFGREPPEAATALTSSAPSRPSTDENQSSNDLFATVYVATRKLRSSWARTIEKEKPVGPSRRGPTSPAV